MKARGKINIQSRVVAEVPQSQMSQMHARKMRRTPQSREIFRVVPGRGCAKLGRMNEPVEQKVRHRWPRLLLGAVIFAVVLAILWVGAEVKRVKQFQTFDYRPQNPTNDPLAGFREALSGGDPAAGQQLFFNKPEASCGRCHRIGDQGGDNGPALDGIGARLTREQLLESLIHPNASIAKGYETATVVLASGLGLSGVLRSENETTLTLHTPDDGERTVPKAEIVRRLAGLAPMPDNFASLVSTNELGDLVAYLASLTNTPALR